MPEVDTSSKTNLNAPEARGWKAAAVVFGVALLVLGAAFWTTYASIVAIWLRSDTFAHGFLILPIVGYLIWTKRADLAVLAPRPTPLVLLAMAGLAVLWLLGYAADVSVVQQLAATAMMPTLAWVIFGSRVVWLIAFPLGYLFFAVPIGDFLVAPLQDLTAAFTVWALQLTGIPVYWEGRFLYIPSGNFEVAEACSGVRYLIASLALGTLYAYLTYTTLRRRLVFIALSAVVPIIANGVRAYGIVMLAHLSDYKLAVGMDHIIYGWVFFGVVILGLFWVGSLFREETVSKRAGEESSVVARGQNVSIGTFVTWAVLATAVAVGAPGLATMLDAQRAVVSEWQPSLPAAQQGWSGPYLDDAPWQPHFVGAVTRRGEYRKDGRRVQVYLAYYPVQTQGAELISWQNSVYDDERARRLGDGITQAEISANQAWPVQETRLESEDGKRMVWHWYEVDGSATVNRVWAKGFEVRGRLLGSERGSAAWLVSARYELVADEAREVLADYLAVMLPALREATKP